VNQPMRFGFDAVMDNFAGEWESELKGDIVPQIRRGEVDLIVFTTCKFAALLHRDASTDRVAFASLRTPTTQAMPKTSNS
jgi:hypothetical protein